LTIKTTQITPTLYNYLISVGVREPEILAKLREETFSAFPDDVQMQISPEQGAFFAMLVKMLSASLTLEIGVFTGYSSLSVALALPDDGKIIACDNDQESTKIALDFWEKAGVKDKIDLRIAPATDTLDSLIEEGYEGKFDFVFIDADKTNYSSYYNKALKLLRTGGVCAIDNVLWSGLPATNFNLDQDSQAIRDFNEMVYADKRVSISLIPIADGVTLARKCY